jgi:molybdenum cofactor biosynthesis enzyme MoaA
MANYLLDEPHPHTYPLTDLYFYLTDVCNLRCGHCWIEPRYLSGDTVPSGIDLALFTSILDQAEPLGLKGVKLTGG